MSADSKLDALLGLLKPTVIRRFDKQRTKARVLERAHARKATIPRPLGLAALLVTASAAAAGVASVVDNRELGDDDARPPRVVQGVPAPKRQGTTPLGHKLSPRRDSPAESPQASQPGGSPVLPGPAAEPSPRRSPKVPPRPAPKPGARSEDPTRVAQALRALRTDNRPERAEVLLEQYLTDHPKGLLAEEALALSIEAAARHDPRLAARHANRYLTRFPNGRFRDVARRALDQAR